MKRLLFLIPSALLMAACKEDAPAPDPIRPVLSMTIAPITAEIFGPFAGTVEARYQTQLGFQASGRMVARDVYVGDVVKKGQRLAALDPTVAQFALTRAKADVADGRAQLSNASGVESRQRILVEGGNAAKAALDNAVASRDTAKARLDQALAALRNSEDQFGYSELHASYDGVIAAWSAEVGQVVSSGQAVVTEARLDEREAVVDIPDALISRVAIGMSFTVSPQVAPAIVAVGLVREIGPLADSATRSHHVRIGLQAPSAAFRLGTTVTVAVERRIAPQIMIPQQTILTIGAQDAVWVVASDGRSVRRQPVTLGARRDGMVLVASGLAAGDRIVTVGVHSLKDGQAVDGTQGVAQPTTRKAGAQP